MLNNPRRTREQPLTTISVTTVVATKNFAQNFGQKVVQNIAQNFGQRLYAFSLVIADNVHNGELV